MKKGIGIIPNLDKEESPGLTRELLRWLSGRGYAGYLPTCTAQALGLSDSGLRIEEWKTRVLFAVVLGGDGTLLGAARRLGPEGVPLLGVNLGHFGFLTELEEESLLETLPSFLAGEGQKDERLMLSARVERNGKTVFKSIALNEACVTKGPYGRLNAFSLKVSGKDVDTYFADGIIVSTPTGSTAYSLSAGGPLLAPHIEALLVTPICPHTLYSRSIVVPSSESCEIEVAVPSQSTMLSLDGQEFFPLEKKDRVVVEKSEFKVVLLRCKGWSFYDVLRKKLKEGADRLPR
ncbi:MAG: NAD(+)/NADH kinase [Candidatus Fermentithermobacillus carboniphilus]|uniref:NAD kinase n=1 Tax=Candidatus Fermentithermobacillus carboniphilus TaxID=3085328 RepID=A0AAT9LCV7_9FIRM|nr:MAG: NAD(+)/NADH kinase [Candidatus Fermentithermobacillus carboniphilus]